MANSLFDAYDPATYQDSQSGLFARLLASGALAPNSPSAGFPQSPMDANAAAPQPAQPVQNDPIAVGNYQMPRIGAGFPDDDTPAAPSPAPAQQPAPAAAPSPPDTIRSHLIAGSQSMGNGGGLIGGLTALVTGQRHDPQNDADLKKQADLQKQYQAYIGTGAFTPQEAQIATINPEAAKVLIAQKLGKDKVKFAQLKDGLGGDHPAFINEDQQTINGQSVADYNKQNGGNASAALGDPSKTGMDYLATLPPKERGTVQAMLDGRQPMPSSYARGKPYWQNIIAAANNVDPTFDETTWPARVAGVKSFKSGADAGTVRSANQVLGHISDLTDKADDLHNGDHPAFNYVKNVWDSQMGSDAANNWTTQAHAVADELSAFMKGAGHSSDTEIQQWKESLSPNMSPTQQKGAIKTLMGIYDHALSALEDKRTGAVGSVAAQKMGPLVTPSGQAAMDKVKKWAAGSAPGAGNTTKSGVSWSVVQ
jgi:hypothetical protein